MELIIHKDKKIFDEENIEKFIVDEYLFQPKPHINIMRNTTKLVEYDIEKNIKEKHEDIEYLHLLFILVTNNMNNSDKIKGKKWKNIFTHLINNVNIRFHNIAKII